MTKLTSSPWAHPRTALSLIALCVLSLGAAEAAPAKKAPAQRRAPAAKVTPATTAAPAAVSAPVAAAPKASTRQSDYIVAVVNSEPITNQEVLMRTRQVTERMQAERVAVPPFATLSKQVLESLITERAQLQAARKTDMPISDAAVEEAERKVAQQNGLTVEQMHRQIEKDGLTVERFRRDLRDQLGLVRVRESLEPRSRITEADVDAVLAEQSKTQRAPELDVVNLAMILVAVPANAKPADVVRLQAKAEAAHQRLQRGEDFAAVARDVSDANNRGRDGGVLGKRPVAEYPELFVSATDRLKVGQTSGVLRSPAGFHILKVLERDEGTTSGITVPQTRVRHILLRTGPSLTERAAMERMADYRRRIVLGGDFAQLARSFSQDGSAPDGGDLGWVAPGLFVPEFEQVMNQLKPGELSQPVVSRYGVHLIQVLERRRAEVDEKTQRELARAYLREKRVAEAADLWAQDQRSRAYVEYREAPSR